MRQHLPGTGESGAWPRVKCANFIGEALDFAAELGFQELLLVGHIGKFCKLAAGIMNTHSRCADGRREVFTAQAALAGAGPVSYTHLPNQEKIIILSNKERIYRKMAD